MTSMLLWPMFRGFTVPGMFAFVGAAGVIVAVLGYFLVPNNACKSLENIDLEFRAIEDDDLQMDDSILTRKFLRFGVPRIPRLSVNYYSDDEEDDEEPAVDVGNSPSAEYINNACYT